MNKKILVIVVILILSLIGAGVFFFLKPSPQVQPKSQNQTAGEGKNVNKPEAIETTLKSLLSMGKSLKCTFLNNTKEATVSGTVYAGNGKVRQDFQSKAAGSSTSGHLIVDGSNTYMWTDGNNQGFKFAVDKVPSASSGSAQSQTQDINKTMNFSCQGWSADNSLFVLPSNVTFESFSIPVIPTVDTSKSGTGINTNQSACSACDNIPAGESEKFLPGTA